MVGIVTAMETEVWPLIRNWRKHPHPSQMQRRVGHPLDFFESDDAVLLCGGIGYEAGKRAAEAMIEYAKPDVLIATGLAGGLKPKWTLGQTMIAAQVIDEATGRCFKTADGEGTVVSSREIARAAKKQELASRFAADAHRIQRHPRLAPKQDASEKRVHRARCQRYRVRQLHPRRGQPRDSRQAFENLFKRQVLTA